MSLVCLFLFFYHLANRDLWSSHEGRAAQDAQTILDDGRWGLPHLFDGHAELQKPPMYYWLVAGISHLRGVPVDAWAVRLPAALAALGGVLLVFTFLNIRGRPLAGLIAAAVLATALHYTWLARVGRIDMPLALAIGVALAAWYLASRSDSGHRMLLQLLAFLAVAVAVMLKGPIGAMLPAVVLCLHALVEKNARPGAPWLRTRWLRCLLAPEGRQKIAQGVSPGFTSHLTSEPRRGDRNQPLDADSVAPPGLNRRDDASSQGLRPGLFSAAPPGLRQYLAKMMRAVSRSSLCWGVPLVLALTLPWYIWVNHTTHGEFFRVFFWHHNVERGLGSSDDLRIHPWWFYGPRWLVDFLPWSPLVIVAAIYLLRRGRWQADAEARFGLVWLIAVIALLSCARFKRADYLLPAYPGAAMLLGCVAERWYQASLRRGRLAAMMAIIILGCGIGWWVFIDRVLPRWEPALDQRPFAQEIRKYVPQPNYVLFFRAESHALAFHLGRPLDTFLEWENLDIWAGRPGAHYIVMPVGCAAEWQRHVTFGRLVEVLRNTDLADGVPAHQQLVLMRTSPLSP